MRLSIITINYNNAAGLQRTAESILSQTYRDFEWIIIDGASTDGSVEFIRNLETQELRNSGTSKNITFKWISEPDKGIYNAMNKGIDRAHGDYCIFMNSGDSFHDDKVLEDVLTLGMTADIISGDIFFDTGLHCLSHDHVSMAHFYEHSLYHQATFIRTSLLKDNHYDENLKIASDWKFFFEEIVLKDKTYQHIHRDIAIFESGGLSADNHELIRKEQLQVLRQHFPENVLNDYEIFTHGADEYDKFFMTLKHSRLKLIIYRIDMIIIKVGLHVAKFIRY